VHWQCPLNGRTSLETLATDLTRRFGRGFSRQNLQYMRQFYVAFPPDKIRQTASGKSALNIRQTLSSKSETVSRISRLNALAEAFPLPWSHYVLLIGKTRSHEARAFYHAEALRGGWSVRQLDRQITSQFYERTGLSRNKAAMLSGARRQSPATPSAPTKRCAIRSSSSSSASRTSTPSTTWKRH
jgi:DUF1016 N-terminal domain